MRHAAAVSVHQILVNKHLALFLWQLQVRDDGHVECHIALENQCSKGDFSSLNAWLRKPSVRQC
jgi:hypothetical protein